MLVARRLRERDENIESVVNSCTVVNFRGDNIFILLMKKEAQKG